MNLKIMKIKFIVLMVCPSALFWAVVVFTQNQVPKQIARLINCWAAQAPPERPRIFSWTQFLIQNRLLKMLRNKPQNIEIQASRADGLSIFTFWGGRRFHSKAGSEE